MAHLDLSFASGEDSLSVRRFAVKEAISDLFSVTIEAVSNHDGVDLDALAGMPAAFSVTTGMAFAQHGGRRRWAGVCSFIEQVHAEPSGLSTYRLSISPALWLPMHRRNYRMFQHVTVPDIVDRLLAEWGIDHAWAVDLGKYPRLEYRVQYGESDYAFLCRMLEEAGISFAFVDADEGDSQLLLADRLHATVIRPGSPIPFVDNPNRSAEMEFVTRVRIAREIRPGSLSIRDHDFRNPGFPLFGQARVAGAPEDRLEQYHYRPGAFLVEGAKGRGTPVADGKGVARNDARAGAELAERGLAADRAFRRGVVFETNTIDLNPGTVFTIGGHAHALLDESRPLLVTELSLEGAPGEEWNMAGRAVLTDAPYRPPRVTPKPQIHGVQTATVVGPPGTEIHPDEFGRVRVQFPWDREGKRNDDSSCWMRVSQGWAGTGYGMFMIPRVGQEVLVGFVTGDPDQPIVVGRVFNAAERVPYTLPEHKTRSTWKSDSSPGSGGFNEIMFEDAAGSELVYMQAQKDQRRLVKHDEDITVGNDRSKLVKINETEITGVNRVELVGVTRTEVTAGLRVEVTGLDRQKLVIGSETERTLMSRTIHVGGNHDETIRLDKKERIGGDSHLIVKGNRAVHVYRPSTGHARAGSSRQLGTTTRLRR